MSYRRRNSIFQKSFQKAKLVNILDSPLVSPNYLSSSPRRISRRSPTIDSLYTRQAAVKHAARKEETVFIQISGILGGREDSSLQLRRKQISRTRPSLYKIILSLSLSPPPFPFLVKNALVDPSNTNTSRVEIEGGAQTSIPRNKRKRYCRGGVTNSFHLAEDARHLLALLSIYIAISRIHAKNCRWMCLSAPSPLPSRKILPSLLYGGQSLLYLIHDATFEAVTRGPGMLMLYGNAVDEVCSNSFECVCICRVSQNSRK